MDETHLYLSVGDFGTDPSVVSEFLGIAPTFAAAVGDPMPGRPSMRRRHAAWEFASPLPRSAPVPEHLAALLPPLEERAVQLRALQGRFSAHVQCVIYVREGCNPGFDLPSDLLARLGALGLSLDFDIYCLGESDVPSFEAPAA